MFGLSRMASFEASSLFSIYASFAGTMMLVRSMVNELIPQEARTYLYEKFGHLFSSKLSPDLSLVIDENCGITRNQVYEAAEIYLRTKVSPSTNRLKVGKTPRQKNVTVSIEKGEEIYDYFEDVRLKWKFVSVEPPKQHMDEIKFYELSFNKRFKDKILEDYFPYLLARAKELKEDQKVIKLFTRDFNSYDDDGGGDWGSIDLEHPARFDMLAMDPEQKKMVKEDLDRFVERKEYYKKVGKVWKRGYLLYGPPGTGKSSLIAAMANYLKFDVYDLELTNIYSNSELRRILVSTTNRSIIVIEDIDCSAQMQDRDNDKGSPDNNKLTLSGMLNFIDGLWSSCGEERIVVFTTNHKEKLDPALLRPGRMDLHVHMSYCTPEGFKVLANNFFGTQGKEHSLCGEIEGLIKNADITPAEVAEELMKGDDPDCVLKGLVEFLKCKIEENKIKAEAIKKVEPKEEKKLETEDKKEPGDLINME